jgi:cytochrome c oxidase subunit 1
MHFLGLAGMPRRIPDYPDAYAGWNAVASFGSYVSVVGICVFFAVVYFTLTGTHTLKSSPNPHRFADGDNQPTTLEWIVQSPPAYHTFEEIPAIKETQSSSN